MSEDLISHDAQTVPYVPLQRVLTQHSQVVRALPPRDMRKVVAASRVSGELLGDAATYGWGSGNDRVEGVSQAAAYELARIMGLTIEQDPVNETAEAFYYTTRVIDPYTGASFARHFRQSKDSIVHGRHDPARKMEMRFAIGESKSTRNAILKMVPEYVVRAMVEAALHGSREKIRAEIEKTSLKDVVRRVLGVLARCGVTEERVLLSHRYTKIDAFTIEDLTEMNANARAIQDGSVSADAIYPLPTVNAEIKIADALTRRELSRVVNGAPNALPPPPQETTNV